MAEKSDISPQFELAWEEGANRFRTAFILTEYLFNDKNDEDEEYDKQPYTIFAEGKWSPSDSLIVSGWANYNSKLTLEQSDESRFSYEQFMMEASVFWKFREEWDLLLSVGNQTGDRKLTNQPATPDQHLNRDNVVATVETQYQINPCLKSIHGLHYFFLDERGLYQNIVPEGGENIRREYMPFGGLRWRVSEKFGFSPTVYLDFIDLDYAPGTVDGDDDDDDETEDDEEQDSDESKKLIGKLALPLEYYFSKNSYDDV